MNQTDEVVEHEIAVLRPEAGDVLVLYLPNDGGAVYRRHTVDVFLSLAWRAGCWPLVVSMAEGHRPQVERWDERTARIAYETLRKRFET